MRNASPSSIGDDGVVASKLLRPGTVWSVTTLLVALACSFALWDPLYIDERRHVRRLTLHAGSSVRADLLSDLLARIQAHFRLAATWGFEVPQEDRHSEEWARDNALFYEHHPYDLALHWVAPQLNVHRLTVRYERMTADIKQAFERDVFPTLQMVAARESQEAVVSRAFFLRDRTTAVALIIPVSRGGRFEGYLVAILDLAQTIDTLLMDHRDLGYSVSVLERGREIYRSAGANADLQNVWAQEVALESPLTDWVIQVWPNQDTLDDMRSPLPELALVLGTLLGFLLMVSLHFARAASTTATELRTAHGLLDRRVQERTRELQNLSARLLQLRDEERRRLARDLHDSTAQMLDAVAINVARARQLASGHSDDTLEGVLKETAEHIDAVTQEIRTVSYLLHPPMLDELGLDYVLRWYVDGFSARSGIPVELEIARDAGRLPHEVELTLFRVAQEALTNIHRHAGPCSARIALRRDGALLTLDVRDTGSGVPAGVLGGPDSRANLGVGLAGMRERVRQLGGELRIESGSHGTLIRVVIPVGEGGETNAA